MSQNPYTIQQILSVISAEEYYNGGRSQMQLCSTEDCIMLIHTNEYDESVADDGDEYHIPKEKVVDVEQSVSGKIRDDFETTVLRSLLDEIRQYLNVVLPGLQMELINE